MTTERETEKPQVQPLFSTPMQRVTVTHQISGNDYLEKNRETPIIDKFSERQKVNGEVKSK